MCLLNKIMISPLIINSKPLFQLESNHSTAICRENLYTFTLIAKFFVKDYIINIWPVNLGVDLDLREASYRSRFFFVRRNRHLPKGITGLRRI